MLCQLASTTQTERTHTNGFDRFMFQRSDFFLSRLYSQKDIISLHNALGKLICAATTGNYDARTFTDSSDSGAVQSSAHTTAPSPCEAVTAFVVNTRLSSDLPTSTWLSYEAKFERGQKQVATVSTARHDV